MRTYNLCIYTLSVLLMMSTIYPVMAQNFTYGNNATATTTEMSNENINQNMSNTPTETATSNPEYTPTSTMMPANTAISTNTPVNTATPMPITEEEKTKVTNIAINFTVNIYNINNPKVKSVERETDQPDNLLVTVSDSSTGENILVVVPPNGEPKEQIQNTQRFTEASNNFNGEHVSFQLVQNTITNFDIDEKMIFQSIDLGFAPTNVKRIGSELRLFDKDDKHMAIIHDNDNGIITEQSDDNIKVIFNVAPGINIKGSGNRVDLSDIGASILSNEPDSDKVVSSVSGNVITVTINNGKSTFIKKSTSEADFDTNIIDGIANDKIGGIINIDADDSFDVNALDVDFTVNRIIKNTIDVNVDSATSDGKVIAFRINKSILDNLNPRILVDRDEIKPAIDINDLFKVDKLSYLIVIGQNIELLVSIPKFSTHQITISTEAPMLTNTAVSPQMTPITTTSISTTSVIPTPTNTVPAPTPKIPGFSILMLIAVLAISVIILLKKRK